ncbi:dynamin family protein [Paractinoplanes hotanensis]|uniref:dynamin family protein n=1 Tax=Paractinoplanes hotanensis TaxID=2906497 RepID=UPI00255B1DCB|nr:dynamin family protein [Actinoplanes hotanensis]
MSLLDDTRALLDRAVAETRDPRLARARGRLDEPLRVAIAGKLKAGKSTLLNALIGEGLAPTDAGECTRVVTWYADGPTYAVTSYLTDGNAEARPFTRRDGAVRIDLGRPSFQVERLEVRVPSARLRRHTLIDTPGIESLSADVSARTTAFLEAEGEHATQTDAVIYLLRHLHSGDVRFLEAFHGDDGAGTPVNAIGVLSRADEIGGCRLDAMTAAERVAGRYATDERLRKLCPVVVPVAGLLGAAGATLREGEFRVLAEVAELPMDDIVELLLTADRFAATGDERRRLVTRLGLFGVRLGTRLIREGHVTDAAGLAAALTENSGITRLREVLRTHIEGRAEVLKARSALAALDDCLPPGSPLVAEAERIRAGAHEFVELRLLHQLRSGRLPVADDRRAELDRLLGGAGSAPSERLGVPVDDVVEAARTAQARWQRLAEHPLSARDFKAAARAAARTCEGILAGQNQQG